MTVGYDWTPTLDGLPPENKEVLTISPGGVEQTLTRVGSLWFVPDGSMYVYYTPDFWKDLDPR